MFKSGEYVVYKKDACKIIEIKHNNFNDFDYYVLKPILDDSLMIEVPTLNNNNLRFLIDKKEISKIIKEIPNIEIIICDDSRLIEKEYKILINSGKHIDLVKVIKTTYLRNKEKIDNKAKPNDKDNFYLCLAEKYLYLEFSLVLNLSYDDTKKYVIDEVNKLHVKGKII